jgi:hypothetical protein
MTRARVAVICLIGCLVVIAGFGCAKRAVPPADGVAGASNPPTSQATSIMPSQSVLGTSTASVQPSVPPGAPRGKGRPNAEAAIVATGKKLQSVQVAPPKTYAMFDLPTPFSGAEFVYVARPYGWVSAPKGASARRLLLHVDSAKALSGQTGKFADLAGQNALVWIDSHTKGADEVRRGGKYRVEVTVRPSGKTGVLYATSISRED